MKCRFDDVERRALLYRLNKLMELLGRLEQKLKRGKRVCLGYWTRVRKVVGWKNEVLLYLIKTCAVPSDSVWARLVMVSVELEV